MTFIYKGNISFNYSIKSLYQAKTEKRKIHLMNNFLTLQSLKTIITYKQTEYENK